jgi:hypothetical protein
MPRSAAIPIIKAGNPRITGMLTASTVAPITLDQHTRPKTGISNSDRPAMNWQGRRG